jgi:hypothetical protein
VSRARGARLRARSGTPKLPPATPELPKATPPAETLSTEAARPGLLEKIGLYLSIFGGIALVASSLSHALILIIFLGLAYILSLAVLAHREKSISWPAWRVIIALVLAGAMILLYYASPKTETFEINMENFTTWPGLAPPAVSDFPVSDNPQTGQEYGNYELDFGNVYYVNARCWTSGHLPGHPKISVSWVSVKGGDYDGLWIPYEAVAMASPGLANDLPNCNSFWFKVFPFL